MALNRDNHPVRDPGLAAGPGAGVVAVGVVQVVGPYHVPDGEVLGG
jgi:hypothetical protein